jgi:hypothetical protein
VTRYPADWAQYLHSIILQPQAAGVGFPIPFTWKNCGATGSGSLPGPWQQGTVQPMSTTCQTLIKLGGNGAGNVSLAWWGNG